MHFTALHKTYIFLKIEVSVEETIFFFQAVDYWWHKLS